MSRYDGRTGDPGSYRDRRSDYGRGFESSSRKEADAPAADLDGLIPFEKNFYVESPSMAAMTDTEVDEFRLQKEITVEGRDVPKPVREFSDVGFPGSLISLYGVDLSQPRSHSYMKIHSLEF